MQSTRSSTQGSPPWYARRALWIVLGLALSLGGAASVYGPRLLAPGAYALIEYSEDAVSPALRGPDRALAWREFFATQQVILTSRTVCERAVAKLTRGATTRVHKDSLVSELQRRANVERIADSRLLRVRYADEDPKRAMMIANALADAYVETVDAERAVALTSFDSQPAELAAEGTNLNEVHQSMEQFIAQNGVVGIESDRALIVEELSHYARTATDMHIRTIELQSQLAQLESALLKGSFHAPRFASDPIFQGLRVRLSELSIQLALLADSNEQSVDHAASVRKQLAALEGELIVCANRVRDDLRAELNVAREEERQLARSMDVVRQRLAEFDLRALEWRRLQRALSGGEALASAGRARDTPESRRWRARVVERASVAPSVFNR
jgi:uncharacterized protein involved in exopolysaccharide biosynthesis